MYQGKFDAKSRGTQAPKENIKNILEERKASAQAAQQPKVTRKPLPPQQAQAIKQPQPVQQNPRQPRPVQQPRAAVQQPKTIGMQPIRPAAPEPVVEEKHRGPRLGSVIFYTVYFLFIFLFFAGVFLVLQWLNGWLLDYEAAQPTVKCQEVFDELFANPDWQQLYVDAGIEDTKFEGVTQYVAFMEDKVGNQELDFVETSGGSGKKKYNVRLDGEKIASFTLLGKSESITDIPDWQQGGVELFFKREQSYRIQKLDGHKAFVNGVELNDDYTIQIVSTKVDKYLPVGAVGVRVCTQEIDGLLIMPEVKITNQKGEAMEVVYDEENRTFAEQTVSTVIPEDEKTVALGAMESYAKFMINASGGAGGVEKYYDSNSQVYKDIMAMHGELWMNSDHGHRFTEETLDNYCRYTDELFSVHGTVVMNATLKDGSSTKDFTIDQTLFFKKKNGNWVCYEATNEDVSQPVGKVRLTFMDGATVLASDFYDSDASELQAPVVSVPNGKVFSGWVRETVNEEGRKTLTVVFTPDDNGKVTLGSGVNLTPMTLYALFEDAEGGK